MSESNEDIVISVKNASEPVRLTGVKLDGVAAESAQPGSQIKVWTRLALTSDDIFFHKAIDGLIGLLRHHTQEAGKPVNFGKASNILLVIRPDETADLWVDAAAVSAQILVKRSVQAGAVIFENDIGDVTGLDFPSVDIGQNDKVLYLFHEDWRFGLFFDSNPERNFSRKKMTATLGVLYRQLKYRHLYDVVANKAVFNRLMDAGWFPFVEIIGSEFKNIAAHAEAGVSFDEVNAAMLKKFDDARIHGMLDRWLGKSPLKEREKLLRSAVRAYKANDPIAAIKIILTEIEGVLSDAYFAKNGAREKLKSLLKFAIESGERKAGAPDTLLLPSDFAGYLERYAFANFDPTVDTGDAGSRHAVGHGIAKADSYTQIKALQVLLTLDQFAFYI